MDKTLHHTRMYTNPLSTDDKNTGPINAKNVVKG